MRLIGCDLHASQQSIALLDCDTGAIVEKTQTHEGGAVRGSIADRLSGCVRETIRSRLTLELLNLFWLGPYDHRPIIERCGQCIQTGGAG